MARDEGRSERNARVCWTTSRRSEVHSHRAQRTPSTCAADECEQMSHFFVGPFMPLMIIKERAAATNFSSA